MRDITQSTINGTLISDASVAELLKLQAEFLADNELSGDFRLRRQGFFTTALFTDTPAMLHEGKTVITILRCTTESTGYLYMEYQRQQAAPQKHDGTEHESVPKERSNDIAVKHTRHGHNNKTSQITQVQAVTEARRTRHGLIHASRMSVASGVVNAPKRSIRIAKPPSAQAETHGERSRANMNKAHKTTHNVRSHAEHVCSSLLPQYIDKE